MYICIVKYEHIKKHHLSHKYLAKALGYKSIQSFRCSSAHQRIMKGINIILGKIEIPQVIKNPSIIKNTGFDNFKNVTPYTEKSCKKIK